MHQKIIVKGIRTIGIIIRPGLSALLSAVIMILSTGTHGNGATHLIHGIHGGIHLILVIILIVIILLTIMEDTMVITEVIMGIITEAENIIIIQEHEILLHVEMIWD